MRISHPATDAEAFEEARIRAQMKVERDALCQLATLPIKQRALFDAALSLGFTMGWNARRDFIRSRFKEQITG